MNNAKLVSEYSSFFNETTEAQFIKKKTQRTEKWNNASKYQNLTA